MQVLKYMTDGMLLREFLSEPDLASYRRARPRWRSEVPAFCCGLGVEPVGPRRWR